MFEHQQELTPQNLEKRVTTYARSLRNFDPSQFRGCLADKAAIAAIDRDVKFGEENGIDGTPTVFMNGQRVSNITSPEQILTLVRQYVSRSDPKSNGSGPLTEKRTTRR